MEQEVGELLGSLAVGLLQPQAEPPVLFGTPALREHGIGHVANDQVLEGEFSLPLQWRARLLDEEVLPLQGGEHRYQRRVALAGHMGQSPDPEAGAEDRRLLENGFLFTP